MFLSYDSNPITENCCQDEIMPSGSLHDRKGKQEFCEIASSLLSGVDHPDFRMPINKHESQRLLARENLSLTNDTLFQCDLICLHVYVC